MSLPKIRRLPSYMITPLNELKRDFKNSLVPIAKSSSPRKSPMVESPRKSPKKSTSKKRIRDSQLQTNVVSPRPNYHYINDMNLSTDYNNLSLINPHDITSDAIKMTKIKSKRKHKITLPEIITKTHGIHLINDKPILPPIGKGGKRRTRKNKSNRRRITLKK